MNDSTKAQAALCHPDYAMAAKLMPSLKLATPEQVIKSRKMLDRFGWLSRANPHVSVENTMIADVRVRTYKPKKAEWINGILLWLHGGGFILGRPENDDRQTAAAALDMNCEIWSIDYRLAPEHPFPSAHRDVLAVWHALQTRPEPKAWIGISGGGGIAAGALQQLSEDQNPLPNAIALIYPMLDNRSAGNHALPEDYHCVWNRKQNRHAWQYYLNEIPITTAYAVPARTAMTRPWPPTWLGVGELDLFYEEVHQFHEALLSVGTETELDIVPDVPHGFDQLNSSAPPSRHFTQTYQQFLLRALKK